MAAVVISKNKVKFQVQKQHSTKSIRALCNCRKSLALARSGRGRDYTIYSSTSGVATPHQEQCYLR